VSFLRKNRDCSVGIAGGYGLVAGGSGARFPGGGGNFSLHHRVQTGSGAHPAGPVGTAGGTGLVLPGSPAPVGGGGGGNFSLHHRVQNGSGAYPAYYPMVLGALSLGVKRPGSEADYSPPSSAEVK
jgi:hypothetical protein